MSEWKPDLERLRNFDDEEWLRVERGYCGRLMAYVARRVADAQAREDIVQEAFLGAVRGIGSFDPVYTFEQYLFGICRNRAIDHLRRRKAVGTGQPADSSESLPGMEDLAVEADTPSQIVHGTDLADQGHHLLVGVLREWVQETWQQGEFTRLSVIEALFALGWRNRDTWERFGLRDETAVAGIKFRALKRMREFALQRDGSGQVLAAMADAAGDAATRLDLDVAKAWRTGRASCPARYWLARHDAKTLKEGPAAFVSFHLDETACPLCQANLDDLRRARDEDLDPLIERVQASTVQYLRSRNLPDAGAG
ncbi:MAG: sigma-70 family RNA polymerase sigma factor [Planctomycetota bacterium]|nr:sigma-70 family RNA polymerase sigma factor [Planctomycetota bacterium]